MGIGGAKPAALDGKAPPPLLTCTPETQAALKRVKLLDERITALRTQLAASATPDDIKNVRELSARIKEQGGLKTKLLTMTAGAPIKLPEEPGSAASWTGDLTFKPEMFERWFGKNVTADAIKANFPLTWTATRRPPPSTETPNWRLRACRKSLRVPAPSDVEIRIKGASGLEDFETSAVFAVNQVNAPADFCIDVGFGEDRTIEVAFDKFGRTTMLHWASGATAANVTGAAAGLAPDVKTLLAKAPQPSLVDQQKAEIERLKTCEAVIAAGGSDCHAEG